MAPRPRALLLALLSIAVAAIAARVSVQAQNAPRRAGRARIRAGQLQPRNPADPLEQLLRVPRARREGAQDPLPLRHEGRGVHQGRRHRPWPRRGQPAGPAHHQHRSRRAHAAARFRPHPDRQADRSAEALDRPGREVGHALGLRRAEAGRAAGGRARATGPARRSTASSSRGSSARGSTPSPEADRETLLRRVTFDLTGLPPTPAEVDAFLARSRRPTPTRSASTRCSHSPHYGERMAMPWLDAARYADTHGYHIDSLREMWPWRDWVIDAFNRNLPFDQFTIEQLAGDLLPERDARAEDRHRLQPQPHDQLRGRRDRRGVPRRVRRRPRRDDRERVHGPDDGLRPLPHHKYDPITQREFYQFFAFFNSVPGAGARRPHRQRGAADAAAVARAAGPARRASRRRSPRKQAALADAIVAPLQKAWEETVADDRGGASRRSTATAWSRTTSWTATSRTSPGHHLQGKHGHRRADLRRRADWPRRLVRRRYRGQLRQPGAARPRPSASVSRCGSRVAATCRSTSSRSWTTRSSAAGWTGASTTFN